MIKNSSGRIEIGLIIFFIGWLIAYYFPEPDGTGIVIWLIGFIIIPIVLIGAGIYNIWKEIKISQTAPSRWVGEAKGPVDRKN